MKKLFGIIDNHIYKIAIFVWMSAFVFLHWDKDIILETLPWLVACKLAGCLCVGCFVYSSSAVNWWQPTSKIMLCGKDFLLLMGAMILAFGLLCVGAEEAIYLNCTSIPVEKMKGLYIASGLSWFVPVLFMMFMRKGKSLLKLPIFAGFQKD